jgi:hypothetical protein
LSLDPSGLSGSATGLHKSDARYPSSLMTKADDNAALVGATLGYKLNTNRTWQPFAHTVIIYHRRMKDEYQQRIAILSIGDGR